MNLQKLAGKVIYYQPRPINKKLMEAIAIEYDSLPKIDDNAREAYEKLTLEIRAQFDILINEGMEFQPFGDDISDPYGVNSKVMCEDIINNKHLWVYNGGKDHPGLSREDNWKFRAIHDVFGHAMFGYSFGPIGEDAAWRSHIQMFSELAGKALTTETRGQNAWVNFGPYKHLPRNQRPFAEQKMALLPKWAHQ